MGSIIAKGRQTNHTSLFLDLKSESVSSEEMAQESQGPDAFYRFAPLRIKVEGGSVLLLSLKKSSCGFTYQDANGNQEVQNLFLYMAIHVAIPRCSRNSALSMARFAAELST